MLCHYCGLVKRPPKVCPDCTSEYIHYVGEGTERIESDLKELFEDARIGRLDRDTMKHVRDFERVLGGFRKGEIDTVQTISGHPILVEAATASAKRSVFKSRSKPTTRILTYTFRVLED